ncbi:hypothetical protein N8344_01335 [bacterium]|nr:hypothetical protein [bacterium]
MNFPTPITIFFFTAWLVTVVYVFSPTSVGEWQAQRDMAYDSTFLTSMNEDEDIMELQ